MADKRSRPARGIPRTVAHCLGYAAWLTGQVIKESVVMAADTLGSGRHIAPVVIYYPLRITRERDIAALIASITMTPGTLALGITGPKEVDHDAHAGERSIRDASAVASQEYDAYGIESAQRFLAVHAMYGHDPQELFDSLADMEERLAPSIRGMRRDFSADDLVERGRPGPRGFRGSHGGKASDETIFDVERLDSTPHSAAYVREILASQDDDASAAAAPDSPASTKEATPGDANQWSRGGQRQPGTPSPGADGQYRYGSTSGKNSPNSQSAFPSDTGFHQAGETGDGRPSRRDRKKGPALHLGPVALQSRRARPGTVPGSFPSSFTGDQPPRTDRMNPAHSGAHPDPQLPEARHPDEQHPNTPPTSGGSQ